MTSAFRHRGVEERELRAENERWAARMLYEASRELAHFERQRMNGASSDAPPYADIELDRGLDRREREGWERDERYYERIGWRR